MVEPVVELALSDLPEGYNPTHVLTYETGGKLRPIYVWRIGDDLVTVDEWIAHAVPDWTVDLGEILYCGEPYGVGGRVVTLRKIPPPRLPYELVLGAMLRGLRTVDAIALAVRKDGSAVQQALDALIGVGKARREERSGQYWYSKVLEKR